MANIQTAVGILALVMGEDQTGTTPDRDRMRYKRGDIVDLYPPGTRYWLPPAEPWVAIEVTGAPLSAAAAKARYQQHESLGEFDAQTGEMRTRPYRRRVYRVDLDALPAAKRTELAAGRYTAMTWAQVRSCIVNTVTNQPEG